MQLLHSQHMVGLPLALFDRQIGSRQWVVIDVGGQQQERKKWLNAKDFQINVIIFFVALDDYNVPSETMEGKSRLEESLQVWDEVLHGETLSEMPVIVFLNKTDLLKEKLPKAPFKKAFSDYDVR
jgi:guanine nucleotide-binding protein subunit alpha